VKDAPGSGRDGLGREADDIGDDIRVRHVDCVAARRFAGRGAGPFRHQTLGCGFGDISGFNRAFKATYGINPSDLRRGVPPERIRP
jgi:AraC-like DNA-binding protein